MAEAIISEEWRPIEGWPYEVSNLGRVRRTTDALRRGFVMVPKGQQLRPMAHCGGYLFVRLTLDRRSKAFLLHRLVCAAFHGPQPSPSHEVAHSDGNRTNNCADNLRWATSAENSADMVIHGRSTRGKQPKSTKLTEPQVLEIRRLLASGEKHSEIAAKFAIKPSSVSSIKLGYCWGWLK